MQLMLLRQISLNLYLGLTILGSVTMHFILPIIIDDLIVMRECST